MNHIQRDGLIFAASTARNWERNFKIMPEVWVGIGRPMKKLSRKQSKAAQIVIMVARIVIESLLEREDLQYAD